MSRAIDGGKGGRGEYVSRGVNSPKISIPFLGARGNNNADGADTRL